PGRRSCVLQRHASRGLQRRGRGRRVAHDARLLPREREVVARAVLDFLLSPPGALALGILLALTIGNPYAKKSAKLTKYLLQASVVGLGFGMDLQKVVAAGRTGLLFTIATITGTLLLGFLLGRAMKIERTTSHLISSGTAICGGSA